jgi:hypothetical protein
MPWIVQQTSGFTKQFSKAGLMPAEMTKYNTWLAAVPAVGPIQAAQDNGFRLNKLKGVENQWELYVGQVNRISFTTSSDPDTVTLLAVGHT